MVAKNACVFSRIQVEYLFKKLRNLFGGRGGGHQKITLDYRGEGGGPRSPKKDYVIFEWPLNLVYFPLVLVLIVLALLVTGGKQTQLQVCICPRSLTIFTTQWHLNSNRFSSKVAIVLLTFK